MFRPDTFFYKIQVAISLATLKIRYNPYNIAKYFRKQGAQIGNGCRILVYSLGTEPYLVKIGNNVSVASGVVFSTHDGGVSVFRSEIPDIQVFGPIIIEDNCMIGQDVILCPDIRIGQNSIVGAGSVVISDIPPNSVVMGVPARAIGSVEKYKEKCVNKWKEQKPPDIIIEEGRNWWNSKHYTENRQKLKRHLMKLFWGRG
jgi:acetyltransferase-like isoleucine patch superfamily enzyme